MIFALTKRVAEFEAELAPDGKPRLVIHKKTAVINLLTEESPEGEKMVVGVQCASSKKVKGGETKPKTFLVGSKHVVLATGGFASDFIGESKPKNVIFYVQQQMLTARHGCLQTYRLTPNEVSTRPA